MFHKNRERSPYFLAAMDFGYTLLAALGVFGGLGWWLDNKFGSRPIFFIGGIGLGLAVGFNSLMRRIKLLDEAEGRRKRRKEPPGPEPKP